MFIVHLRDGKTLTEKEASWKDVPLEDITSLQIMKWSKDGKDRYFTVSVDGKNVKLIQLKRAVLDMIAGTNEVSERVIGFIIDKYAVKMEIDEKTNNVLLTLEVNEGKRWIRL